MAKKKPDQVADNPNILPYASNVGAPVIKPTDLTSFKQEKILSSFLHRDVSYLKLSLGYSYMVLLFSLNLP